MSLLDSKKPGTEVPSGQGIRSIEVGMRLLDVLIELKRPARLKQLAALAEFSPSKARMYLVSLIRAGLIEQNPETGLYQMGPKALRMGLVALGQNHLLRLSRELIDQLGRETSHLLLLSAWDGLSPVIIDSSTSPEALPIVFRTGAQTPLWATATGAIYLAFLPATLVERLMRTECRPDEREFVEHATQVARTTGFVRTDVARLSSEVTLTGYGAIAAPIFRRDGELEFVVTMLVPASTSEARKDELGALLLARIKEVSQLVHPSGERQQGPEPTPAT
jgi:DNA-binding IclR family transcriptional regulator